MAFDTQKMNMDFRQLMKIPVYNRFTMAQNGLLTDVISMMTPTQAASLFPNYYKQNLPSITGFDLATTRMTQGTAGSGGSSYSQAKYSDGSSGSGGGSSGTGRKASVVAAAPTIDEMKKKLLQNGIDVNNLRQGIGPDGVPANSSQADFLKNASEAQLAEMGFSKVKNENGNEIIKAVPTKAEALTDEQAVAEYEKKFSSAGFSPRERATLDFIAKREGAKDPNIIFGDVGGKPGSGKFSQQLQRMGYTKPLTEMTISEVRAMQKDLIKITKNNIGKGDLGTSAVGSGQMIGTTLEANLRALGIPEDQWDKIKFDKDLQERLTLENFKTSGIGDPNQSPSTWNHNKLGDQYESLDIRKHPPMTQSEAAAIENASPEKPVNQENVTAEEARTKLIQQEQQAREDATVKFEFGQTASSTGQNVTGVTGSDGSDLVPLEKTSDVNLEGVDPRLVEAVTAGAAHLPPGYKVYISEGYTQSGHTSKSQHKREGSGALDVHIVDPDGNEIPNEGADTTGMYKLLGQHVYGEMMARHPELNGKLAHGAAFGTVSGGTVPDLMHFDLGGERGRLGPTLSQIGAVPDTQYGPKTKPDLLAPTTAESGGVPFPIDQPSNGQAPAPATATPVSAQKTMVISMGTNDWADPSKTYDNTSAAIRAAQAKGYKVVVIPPINAKVGKTDIRGASAEVRRAAADAGVDLEEVQDWSGYGGYHPPNEEAKRIAAKYPGQLFVGDSIANQIGTFSEGGSKVATDGINTTEILNNVNSDQVVAQAQPSATDNSQPAPQKADPLATSVDQSGNVQKNFKAGTSNAGYAEDVSMIDNKTGKHLGNVSSGESVDITKDNKLAVAPETKTIASEVLPKTNMNMANVPNVQPQQQQNTQQPNKQKMPQQTPQLLDPMRLTADKSFTSSPSFDRSMNRVVQSGNKYNSRGVPWSNV